VADQKGKGAANVPATADIEWGIDWGIVDFANFMAAAGKSVGVGGTRHMSPPAFTTPPEEQKMFGEDDSNIGGSSSSQPVHEVRERRIQKPPASQRSPYVNVEARRDFNCSA
jgi:hypothetical protein